MSDLTQYYEQRVSLHRIRIKKYILTLIIIQKLNLSNFLDDFKIIGIIIILFKFINKHNYWLEKYFFDFLILGLD